MFAVLKQNKKKENKMRMIKSRVRRETTAWYEEELI